MPNRRRMLKGMGKIAKKEVFMAARKKQENVEEKQQKEQTLEESFAELDAVMEELEQGDISLEASFALYQRGMQLVKQCNASIDRVEKQLIALEEEGIG